MNSNPEADLPHSQSEGCRELEPAWDDVADRRWQQYLARRQDAVPVDVALAGIRAEILD